MTMQRLRPITSVPAIGLVGALLIIGAVFALTAPNFLTGGNAINIARASSIFGMAALAISVPLIAGGLDVSVGAIISAAAIIAARLVAGNQVLPVVLIGAALAGAGLGAVNGLLATRLRLDVIIVSLGTLSVYGGFAFAFTNGTPSRAPGAAFGELGRGNTLGLPNPVWALLALAAVAWALLNLTSFGQRCFVVGDNPRAARLAGIRVDRTRVLTLAFSGAAAGIAGVFLAAERRRRVPRLRRAVPPERGGRRRARRSLAQRRGGHGGWRPDRDRDPWDDRQRPQPARRRGRVAGRPARPRGDRCSRRGPAEEPLSGE